jgi:hypothetical protein
MLPFGKLEQDNGPDAHWIRLTRAQEMSAWRARFERAGCEVEREGEGRLNVLLPGWDGALLGGFKPGGPMGPEGEVAALMERCQRWFWDRMIITVSETGAARFRLVYFSQAQLFFHLLVTLLFVLEVWFGTGVPTAPARFALMFAATQFVPALIALGGFKMALTSALRRAAA